MSNDKKTAIHWFHGASVRDLVLRLAGANDPWLGVVLDGDAPLLRVRDGNEAQAEAFGGDPGPPDINDSRTCPPFLDCPPD